MVEVLIVSGIVSVVAAIGATIMYRVGYKDAIADDVLNNHPELTNEVIEIQKQKFSEIDEIAKNLALDYINAYIKGELTIEEIAEDLFKE